jgi:hypothetical protein
MGGDVNAEVGKFHGKAFHAAAVAARRKAIQSLITRGEEWHAVGDQKELRYRLQLVVVLYPS